jgi:hypothetical protein
VCTLIALHRRFTGAPLVIAANRDEFLNRPSEGPALRRTQHGVVVAPRDARAGGTWLGLNGAGVFAAVTNRPSAEPDPRRRSRGLLVMDALRWSRADEAAEKLEIESLQSGTYNPFNLFVADSESCFLFTYLESPRRFELGPGAHVIGNVDPEAERTPKLAALDRAAGLIADERGGRPLDGLAALCRTHTGSGNVLDDTCVHAGGYGTRSSTLLQYGENEADRVFRYADGAPCCTEYEDYTPLLRDLRHASGYVEGATATRSAS